MPLNSLKNDNVSGSSKLSFEWVKIIAFKESFWLKIFTWCFLKAPHSGYCFCHSFFGPAKAGLKAIEPLNFSGKRDCKFNEAHPPADQPANTIFSKPWAENSSVLDKIIFCLLSCCVQ